MKRELFLKMKNDSLWPQPSPRSICSGGLRPPHSSHNGRVRHTKSAPEKPSGAELGNKLLLLMPLSLWRGPNCAADSRFGCRADGRKAEQTGTTGPPPPRAAKQQCSQHRMYLTCSFSLPVHNVFNSSHRCAVQRNDARSCSLHLGGGSDIMGRLRPVVPGPRDRRPKAQTHQKGLVSKTADLPNVNCHLTQRPTAAVPPGSRCRSGVEREFNQGFSCYKRPSTPVGKPRRQTEAKGHEMGPALCSPEG